MSQALRQLAHELAEQTDQELAGLRQFELIAQGAQAAVYISTDPALGRESTPPGLYVTPRVMKIALGNAAILGYVRDAIGITDPVEQTQKVHGLMLNQFLTFGRVLTTAVADEHMDEQFGRPRGLVHALSAFFRSPEDTFGIGSSYTQDYLPTAEKVFGRLDLGQAAHRKLGRHLIRQFVDFQAEDLIPYGFLDTSYKLLNNYGVAVGRRFTLRNIDFSELCMNKKIAAESIHSREWEQMPERRESAQLPDYFREYFEEQLRQRLTPDQLERWGRARPPHPERLPLPTYIDFEAGQAWMDYVRNRQDAARGLT